MKLKDKASIKSWLDFKIVFGSNCVMAFVVGLAGLWFTIDLFTSLPPAAFYIWAITTVAVLGVFLYSLAIYFAAIGFYNLNELDKRARVKGLFKCTKKK